MKSEYIQIGVILDHTGSMESIRDGTIGGQMRADACHSSSCVTPSVMQRASRKWS